MFNGFFYAWDGFKIVSAAMDTTTGKQFVTVDGDIYLLDSEDPNDDGANIEVNVRFGYQDWGSPLGKITRWLALSMVKDTTDTVYMYIRHRDKIGGAWSSWRQVPLNTNGNFDRRVFAFGRYKERQWEFNYNGSKGITLKQVTEYSEGLLI